jgi:hypothetical protein
MLKKLEHHAIFTEKIVLDNIIIIWNRDNLRMNCPLGVKVILHYPFAVAIYTFF